MEDTYREPESLKSDEFKKLKPAKEELLLDSSNTNAVKGVQSFLNSEGYTDKNNETLWVDGRYGANTANAVMKYQRANGLTVDGIVGDETWNSIYKKKKQKEEEEIFEIMRNDLWGNIDSSYAKDVSEDEESFHDRVRKRWGNGGKIPSLDSKGVKKGYDAPQKDGEETDYGGIFAYGNPNGALTLSSDKNYVPAPLLRYNPGGIAFNDYVVSDGVQYFSGSNRKEDAYVRSDEPNEKVLATEEPELTLMSNSGSGKGTNSNSKAGKEKETEELGILKPGYNAKGEWSEDPDADNYGEDSPKYKLLTVFDKAWDSAESTGKRNLSAMSINLRDFDIGTINKAYYLNNEFGAMWQGHAAILLINQHGEGIMFSYGANTSDIIDGPARMNIGIYGKKAIEDLLNNKEVFVVSDTGTLKKEKYGRYTDYTISVENGLKMFAKATEMTEYMEDYNVLTNNCDQVTVEILKAGGVNIFSFIRPNWTYDWESKIDFVRDLAKGE